MRTIPLGEYVLVQRVDLPESESSKKTIIIPDATKRVSRYAIVMDATNSKLPIVGGDKVLIAQYGGVEVTENLALIKDTDILAKLA
ncbi:MAG: hypothetical protein RR382_00020 [Tannerellaceae bacterium]